MDDTTRRVLNHYRDDLDEAAHARLDFAAKLWELQDSIAQETPADVPFDEEAARDALATGQPLFLLWPPAIDAEKFIDSISRVATLVADEAGIEPEIADALRAADFAAVIDTETLEGATKDLDEFTQTLADALGATDEGPLSPIVLRVTVAATLAALLKNPAAAIIESLGDYDWKVWSSGSCPVCGAPATFSRILDEGELQGGRRVLWCALCDTEWEFDRMRCARCGSRKHSDLKYLMNREDPGHRIHACDQCHGYIKTAFESDLGMATSSRVEDAVTLELDAVARAEGYTPLGDDEE